MNEFELGKELSTVENDVNSLRDEVNSFKNTYTEGVDIDNRNFRLAFDALNKQNETNKKLMSTMSKGDAFNTLYTMVVGAVCLVLIAAKEKELRNRIHEVENRMSKYDAELEEIRAEHERDCIHLHEEILKTMNGFTSTTITNNRL